MFAEQSRSWCVLAFALVAFCPFCVWILYISFTMNIRGSQNSNKCRWVGCMHPLPSLYGNISFAVYIYINRVQCTMRNLPKSLDAHCFCCGLALFITTYSFAIWLVWNAAHVMRCPTWSSYMWFSDLISRILCEFIDLTWFILADEMVALCTYHKVSR